MKIVLTASSDNELSSLGLNLTGDSRMVPDTGDGYLLAHDIVEHVNGADKIGGIEDELEALGALWLVRGQYADIRRPYRSIYTPERAIASDVVSVMSYWHGRKLRFNATRAHEHDEAFDYVLSQGVNDAGIHSECDHLTPAQRHTFLVAAKHLMRTGARKLSRKFYRLDRCNPEYAANTLFYNIVETVSAATKFMHEGAQFELQIVGLDARMRELEPDYDY